MYIFVNEKRIVKKPIYQNFSIPSNIIYYITKFPSSSKAYQMLIQTCAYFFSQNPIVILNSLRYVSDEWQYSFGLAINNINSFKSEECQLKLWLNNFLLVNAKENVLNSVLPKLYRCELSKLTVSKQVITFNEYKFLTESGTINQINFHNVAIYGDDNKIVTFDQVIKPLAALRILECTYNCHPYLHFTSETAFEMCKLQPFQYLTYFHIDNLHDAINLTHFLSFIMKNCAHVAYRINFLSTASEGFRNEFKKMLEKNSFFCKKTPSYIPTLIFYRPKVERKQNFHSELSQGISNRQHY